MGIVADTKDILTSYWEHIVMCKFSTQFLQTQQGSTETERCIIQNNLFLTIFIYRILKRLLEVNLEYKSMHKLKYILNQLSFSLYMVMEHDAFAETSSPCCSDGGQHMRVNIKRY